MFVKKKYTPVHSFLKLFTSFLCTPSTYSKMESQSCLYGRKSVRKLTCGIQKWDWAEWKYTTYQTVTTKKSLTSHVRTDTITITCLPYYGRPWGPATTTISRHCSPTRRPWKWRVAAASRRPARPTHAAPRIFRSQTGLALYPSTGGEGGERRDAAGRGGGRSTPTRPVPLLCLRDDDVGTPTPISASCTCSIFGRGARLICKTGTRLLFRGGQWREVYCLPPQPACLPWHLVKVRRQQHKGF